MGKAGRDIAESRALREVEIVSTHGHWGLLAEKVTGLDQCGCLATCAYHRK